MLALSSTTTRGVFDQGKALRNPSRSYESQVRSAVTRDQAQKGELLYALKNAFNGALTPMVQCLLNSGEVTPAELAELEALIKARKKSARK